MSKIMYDENYTADGTGDECWDEAIPRLMEHDDINPEFKFKSAVKEEQVNHPSHYNQGGIECIDGIDAACKGLTGSEAFYIGVALKYLWRWKWKNGKEDLEKAVWYINRLISLLDKNK